MTESVSPAPALYEGFTGQARRAVQLAHQQAVRFHNDHVGTVHLLLGVLREGSGGAARLLAAHGLEPEKVCRAVEPHIAPDVTPPGNDQLPLTPAVKRILEHAREEANLLHHSCIGTEHLLLGVLREWESLAVEILEPLGLTLATLRETARGLPEPENRDWLLRGPAAPGSRASGDPSARDLESVVTPDPLPGRPCAEPVRQPSASSPAELCASRDLVRRQPDAEEQLVIVRLHLRILQVFIAIACGTVLTLLARGPAGVVVGLGAGVLLALVRNTLLAELIGCGAGLLSVYLNYSDHGRFLAAIIAGGIGFVLGAVLSDWSWMRYRRGWDEPPESSRTSPTDSDPSGDGESP
jgi:hypothetical protein